MSEAKLRKKALKFVINSKNYITAAIPHFIHAIEILGISLVHCFLFFAVFWHIKLYPYSGKSLENQFEYLKGIVHLHFKFSGLIQLYSQIS